ncbi:glycosyltransferase [Halomicrobium salinisoli]|uniref:glycosyltransferase n=1 Tax=Halomicrobium salinisoli TaxID=2878391 RepID=UPI001CEFFB9F|nr:glycosyltransferase [Halomicrobium salinisoli]
MVRTLDVDPAALDAYERSYESSDRPKISVVVPVYDNPAGLERTVRSVTGTSFEDYELRTVVTPSSGETLQRAEALAAEFDRVAVDTETEYETPANARNVGIEASSGEIVHFLDDDMSVRDGHFWTIAWLFDSTPVEYLGGEVEVAKESGSDTVWEWYDAHVRFPNEFFMNWVDFCPTCCLAVDRSLVSDDVGFDPTLVSGEDIVFGHRLSEQGAEFGYCPALVAEHPARSTLGGVVRKGTKTGQGLYQLYHHSEADMFDRSPLLDLERYLPRADSHLPALCSEWDALDRSERAAMIGIHYVERLARQWGYARRAVTERVSS